MSRKLPRLLMFGTVVLIALLSSWSNRHRPAGQGQGASDLPPAPITGPRDNAAPSEHDGGVSAAATQPTVTPEVVPSDNKTAGTVVPDVTVRDQDRGIVHQGEVDLTDTLSRIDAGDRLSFPNDGSVFQNRERRLPARAAGYYREWVHPTPGIPGPGPQRVVTGKEHEAYYTPDHYRTFQRVR